MASNRKQETFMTIQLYHCKGARSMRPLWTLEEMGLEYDLHSLKFPPRVHLREYIEVNPLGTVPYFIDGESRMTESPGICHYLVTKYGPTPLGVDPAEPDFASFMNWLYYSDATMVFPMTLVFRYTELEPPERRNPQVVDDYRRWFYGRLKAVELATADREFLCADRFTIADICVGYGLHFAERLGLAEGFRDNTREYWERLKAIPSYQRVREM